MTDDAPDDAPGDGADPDPDPEDPEHDPAADGSAADGSTADLPEAGADPPVEGPESAASDPDDGSAAERADGGGSGGDDETEGTDAAGGDDATADSGADDAADGGSGAEDGAESGADATGRGSDSDTAEDDPDTAGDDPADGGSGGAGAGLDLDVPGVDAGGYLGGVGGYLDGVRADLRESRTFKVVAGITLASLLVRLLYLGQRTAHWDEGRVAYWTVRYMESGVFEYRPIVHGPFLFQVNKWLFAILGPSDAVARLPVALVGGLLPLTAWLLRERLKSAEVVALAVLLAGSPLLVYYSRFMRNDVLVAGFMLFALALFVRALDTGRHGYLYAGTASFALGFTAKENAIVYTVCWLGALALLLDHRLFSGGREPADPVDGDPAGDSTGGGPTGGDPADGSAVAADGAGAGAGTLAHTVDTAWIRRVDGYLDDAIGALAHWWLPLTIAGVEFFAILVFFFAPRGGGYAYDGGPHVGLWMAFTDPATFPAVVEEALVGSWEAMYGTWIDTGKDLSIDEYVGLVENFLHTMRSTAGVVSLFALVGFVFDRWSAEGPRDVVSLAGYWGAVSVLGYPYATDIWAPWVVVHAVVPLSIPAAVGVAMVYAWGRDAAARGDEVPAALALVVLLVMAVPAGVTAVDLAYLGSDTDRRVMADVTGGSDGHNQRALQWAQPGNGLKGTLGTVRVVAQNNEGVDVLFYGSTNPASGQNHFYVPDDEVCANQPPVHVPQDPCNQPDVLDWHSRLPLPWYMAAHGATVDSTPPGEGRPALNDDPPPVVITYGWDARDVQLNLPDSYVGHRHRFKLWSEDVVVFIDRDAVPE